MNNISILFTVTKLILCASDILRSIKTRQSSSSYCLLLNAAVYFAYQVSSCRRIAALASHFAIFFPVQVQMTP
ncbi:hypothetical protein EB796_010341 [Bugula neritina]|uniref:Secreted protein n=1 Tax=Bugula neritina TaxID=10212 RepID=A0A7J7JYA8_BUGNE|nr:hypothetical protein EB796_010341 [Bugula neritina]